MSNIKRYGNRWEQTKLGNLGTFIRGRGIPKRDLREEGVPCILYGEIYTTYNTFTSKLKSRSKIENLEKSPQIKFGDILFATSGETRDEIGKHVMYLGEETAIAGGDILVFRPKDEIKNLAYSYVLETESIRKQKFQLAEGHSVVHLYQEHLSDLKVPLIPKDEQQKIASILSTWDEAIKKREKYLRALKDRKYSLMFKLIKDRNVGQVREYRLEEVASRRKGKPVEIHEDGKYPILTIDSLTKMEFDDYTNDNFVLATEKDILLLWDGSNAGSIFTDVQGAVGSTFMRLRPNEELVNSIYIREYMRLDEEYIKSIREGSGIPHIPRDFLTYYKLKLPSLEKQNEVADILELADKEISLVEEHIVYLQEQKRGLMQLLLTGKVRV